MNIEQKTRVSEYHQVLSGPVDIETYALWEYWYTFLADKTTMNTELWERKPASVSGPILENLPCSLPKHRPLPVVPVANV